MPYTPVFSDNEKLRKKNRATVEQYMSMKGSDRKYRWMLYAEDCKNMVDGFMPGDTPAFNMPDAIENGEGEQTPPGIDFFAGGIENQKQAELFNAVGFPDWAFYNNVFYETEDPNYIIVEGDGWGTSYLNKERPNFHKDHYYHCFRMVDGKIRNYSEIRNALGEEREFGHFPVLPYIEKFEAQFETTTNFDLPVEVTESGDPASRAKNLETVKAYFSGQGADFAQRYKLFTEDGTSGPGYTADGRILRTFGREKLKAAEALRAQVFPDWRYSELIIHQCTDPGLFAADVVGEGTCVGYGDKPFAYKEHFYYSFVVKDGLIVSVREYYDPARLYQLMGWDMQMSK